MQISDLVNQYNNNLASGPEITTRSQGVEQLVSTVSKLQTGQVFEGTVNSVKGNTVILGLSSGQNITATLARDMNIVQGQSIFFQVKSNDGQTIQIRPVTNNALNNPTLLSALDAANLSVNERNVNMVNNMMREQMPIDSNSLNNMAKIINANSDVSVATLIQMNKAGLEITPQMVAQYENYKANQASVMNTISELSQSIPQMLSSEELDYSEATSLNKEIVDILSESVVSSSDSSATTESIALQAKGGEGELIYQAADGETAAAALSEEAADATNDSANGNQASINSNVLRGAVDFKEGIDSFISQVNGNTSEAASVNNSEPNANPNTASLNNTPSIASSEEAAAATKVTASVSYNQDSYPVNTIGHTLSADEYKALNELIKNDTNYLDNHAKLTDENGNLDPKASVSEFMKSLADYVDNVDIGKASIKHLFSSDAYKSLVDNMTEQQWTLDPADVAKKDPVKQLYDKLEHSMARLEQATQTIDKAGAQVSKATSEIRSNIDFMNQVNQQLSYVQLPIRMSNQNTNTELYVYKNKRIKADNDEISAFLHFDMDHLGSTDISVKLRGKNVDTKFYMEDDRSYELIMNNIDILRARIEDKGYSCNINVENDGKKVNLVDDFLRHDSKGSTTPVSRYSFDVRA